MIYESSSEGRGREPFGRWGKFIGRGGISENSRRID
jgi:hypothetical protein